MPAAKPLIIGISGPSSSGKTTLSRLLRDTFNGSHKARAFIVHQDDFYKTDTDIPINAEGLQDWDCLESIDWPLFERTLSHVAQYGELPPDFSSKEDKNSIGKVEVDSNVISYCEADLWSNLAQHTHLEEDENLPVAIVDGFLLFAERVPAPLRDLFSLRLFLRSGFETTKARREARQGYVTIEGFWQDPPGYVDKVVWPNYVKDHRNLFKNGDVNGEYDEQALEKLGIEGMPKEVEGNMTGVLQWAHVQICMAIRSIYHRT